jgi:hypothetical protein
VALWASAEPPPSLRGRRLTPDEAIRVDGRLDEAAWTRAEVASGFRQREPDEGAAASEPTELRVVFDDHTLYIGVLARDREPERLIARVLQRDRLMDGDMSGQVEFEDDDGVAILLDPFLDHRNGVVFATNPNGAEFDALLTDEGASFNPDWRGVWEVAAQRGGFGWSAEFAIPFRSLRYPDGGPGVWGFNAYRVVRRRNEESLWSGWQREGGGFHRVSRAGTLLGLEGLPRSGVNLELKPYFLGGAVRERAEGAPRPDADAEASLGGDLKWEVSPGLVLDLTLRPDFAQVEADDEQVNLTRFDLFFPEKRDFFLENAGVFDFGFRGWGEPPPLLLFFSRRVGINEDEEAEVPVLGGARLSGRAGGQTLGVLDMVTRPAFGEGHVNYAVLRAKRDVGRSGYLGVMATDRRGRGIGNTTAGADLSLWPRNTLNLQAFVAGSATRGAGGDDVAYRVGLDYTGERFGLGAQHLGVGPEFKAELGFVTREDIRRNDLFGRVTLRPRFLGLRKITLFLGGQYIDDFQGQRQDIGGGPWGEIEWASGEQIEGFWGKGRARVDEEFDLADRITVPLGDYRQEFWGLEARTSAHRPVSADCGGFFQDNFGGSVSSYGCGIQLTPNPHLSLRVGYGRNKAELPGGCFDAPLATLRLGAFFSRRLSATAFLQWNGLDRELVTNLRVNFIHRPGSDLYVVINDDRGSEQEPWSVTNQGVVLKLTYLVRF